MPRVERLGIKVVPLGSAPVSSWPICHWEAAFFAAAVIPVTLAFTSCTSPMGIASSLSLLDMTEACGGYLCSHGLKQVPFPSVPFW
jgi:hypothetical protein